MCWWPAALLPRDPHIVPVCLCVCVCDTPPGMETATPGGPAPFTSIRECLEADPLLSVVVRCNEALLSAEEGGRNTLISRIVAVIKVCVRSMMMMRMTGSCGAWGQTVWPSHIYNVVSTCAAGCCDRACHDDQLLCPSAPVSCFIRVLSCCLGALHVGTRPCIPVCSSRPPPRLPSWPLFVDAGPRD